MNYSVLTKNTIIELPDRTIAGTSFIPEAAGGKLPSVILSHGYNSSRNDLADLALALAENGIFAFSFDFCGGSLHSESSGSSLDMSVNSEINDLKSVISYIESIGTADTDKIFLYGESQGGLVSALTADERIKGLYLLYPAFCIPHDWKNRSIPDKKEFMGMYLSQKFCDGIPDRDVYELIGKYNGRVRIYHGSADRLVDISYSEKAKKAFPHASLDIFPDEGHGFSRKAREKLIRSICADIKSLSA